MYYQNKNMVFCVCMYVYTYDSQDNWEEADLRNGHANGIV